MKVNLKETKMPILQTESWTPKEKLTEYRHTKKTRSHRSKPFGDPNVMTFRCMDSPYDHPTICIYFEGFL